MKFNKLKRSIAEIMKGKKKAIPMAIAAILLFSAAACLYWQKSAAEVEGDGFLILPQGQEAADEGGAQQGESQQGGDPAGIGESGGSRQGGEGPASVIVVDVAGAVNAPSVLTLPEGSRVYEAIASAGGLAPNADMGDINRAAILLDGDKLYVPEKQEPQAGGARGGAQAGTGRGPSGSAGAGIQRGSGGGVAPVNINTADSEALQALSGVGPSTAQKIIDYRAQNGPFEGIEDIMSVSGIGTKTFEKLKGSICTE